MLKTPFINIRISQRLLSIEALQKARYRVVAATTRGAAVSSYYEVPRVVAIPHDGEYIATTAFTHRVTQAILLRLRRGRASLTHVVR